MKTMKEKTALPKIDRETTRELAERHSWAYHAGNFGGIDIHIDIEQSYYNAVIDPDKSENAHYFAGYTKKEMKSYHPVWSYYDGTTSGKISHTKKTRLDWSVVRVKLTPFVNNIQIANESILNDVVEVGYAPSANEIDAGDPVWITTDVALAGWVSHNQAELETYALHHLPLAFELLTKSLAKLAK